LSRIQRWLIDVRGQRSRKGGETGIRPFGDTMKEKIVVVVT